MMVSFHPSPGPFVHKLCSRREQPHSMVCSLFHLALPLYSARVRDALLFTLSLLRRLTPQSICTLHEPHPVFLVEFHTPCARGMLLASRMFQPARSRACVSVSISFASVGKRGLFVLSICIDVPKVIRVTSHIQWHSLILRASMAMHVGITLLRLFQVYPIPHVMT